LLPTGPRLTYHHSVNKIPSWIPERLLPDAFLCWSSTSPLADWSSSSAPWSSPLFASLYLRRRRLGLRRSSLAFIFAADALVFRALRFAEPVEDLVVASRLSAGLRSLAKGGVPNTGLETRITRNNFGYRRLKPELAFGFFEFWLWFFGFGFRVSGNLPTHTCIYRLRGSMQ